MLTTQRLILILVAINLSIGIAMDAYYEPENDNQNAITREIQLAENYQQEVTSETGFWGSIKRWTSTTFQDLTFGNPIKWGWELAKILGRGINPLSFGPSDFAHPVEQYLAGSLVFVRSMLMLLAGLEMYLLIINRKQT